MPVKERLIVGQDDKDLLDRADELLDQMAEDAQDLGQDDGARIARQAAEAIRKFVSRFDRLGEPGERSDYRLRAS